MLATVVLVPAMKQFVKVMYRVVFKSMALTSIKTVDLNVTPVNVMFHSPAPSERFVKIVEPDAE